MPSLSERLRAFLRAPVTSKSESVRQNFAIAESENTLLTGSQSYGTSAHDRPAYDRQGIMEDCLEAWRTNPIARRIVELTTQYAAEGLQTSCAHAPTQSFIHAFWEHPLNRMSARMADFSDELSRSGNLFLLLSTDPAGMSYVRIVPSADLRRIDTRSNDVEQEIACHLLQADGEERIYPIWQPGAQHPRTEAVMLHFAINRPSGAVWGESDLAPILKWLTRYTAWLEDRVRLNRFRNAFLYVVKARFASESSRSARQHQLALHPPAPGSVLVTDESEEWSVLSPKLEALDASSDGLAIKKMIAIGAGLPLHFLAEPEQSTRTTAESSDQPTYRRFAARQRVLCEVCEGLLRAVLARRAPLDPAIDPLVPLSVRGGDVSLRDNGQLAQSGHLAMQTALELYDKGLIPAEEVLRLSYRFMDEPLPTQ